MRDVYSSMSMNPGAYENIRGRPGEDPWRFVTLDEARLEAVALRMANLVDPSLQKRKDNLLRQAQGLDMDEEDGGMEHGQLDELREEIDGHFADLREAKARIGYLEARLRAAGAQVP